MQILGLAILAIGLLSLSLALVRGVAPKVACESGPTRAATAWIDLWIPLMLALPMGAAAFFVHPEQADPFAVWAAAGPSVAVGAIVLGVALAWRGDSEASAGSPWRGLSRRHGLMFVGLGGVLLFAAESNRLDPRQGQLLLTVAVVWLWACSVGRPPERNGGPGVGRLILDWAEPLRQPIGGLTKSVAGVAVVLTVAGCWLVGASVDFLWVVGAVAVTQLVVLLAMVESSGRLCAQRTVGSTLILSLLLGLGAVAMARHPWLLAARIPPYELMGTSVLGLSSLRGAAILLLGMGMLGLLRFDRPSFWSGVCTGALLIVGALVVLLTGWNQALQHIADAVNATLYQLIMFYHSQTGTGP
ncbi:MAG: hypothetical protein ACF8PN_15790 [Phycisphaerales bacterium]